MPPMQERVRHISTSQDCVVSASSSVTAEQVLFCLLVYICFCYSIEYGFRFTETKSERGVSYERNDIEVEFPKQLSHIFPNNYKLYATVNHRGTMEFGHYIAMSRNPVTERYVLLNDLHILMTI